MPNRDVFSKRLKLLRKTYGLTLNTLVNILGYKHTGIISLFENNKHVPSFDSLIQIANLFAVSLDWLFGYVDDPYNEEILTSLEKNYVVSLLGITLETSAISLPEIYTNTEFRRRKYTHGQRANLIFIALSSYYKTWNIPLKVPDEKKHKKLLKDYFAKIEEIDLLLNESSNRPIWDLESAMATIKKTSDF